MTLNTLQNLHLRHRHSAMMVDPSVKDLTSLFTWVDYLIFIGVLVGSGIIGLYIAYTGGKDKTMKYMLTGNKKLPVFPVAVSVLASFISSVALLGNASEMYEYGTEYLLIFLSYFLTIPVTAYLYMPLFYKLEITTVYEYLEMRFNKVVKAIVIILFSIQTIIYMSISLYAPALALSEVTGLTVWTAVLSVGIICTIYTSVGGIKAVVWTDTFQTAVMLVALIIILVIGSKELGGLSAIFEANGFGERFKTPSGTTDFTVRHTLWGLVFGGFITWTATYGVNQTMIMRYITIPKLSGARKTVWFSLPGLTIVLILSCMCGLYIYAAFYDCDPVLTQKIADTDQLFPYFVMEYLGSTTAIPGIFAAGVFAASISTVSSGINALASVTFNDVILRLKSGISDKRGTHIITLLGFVYGLIGIGVVYIAQNLGSVLQASMSINGGLGGPILGVFTLGMFFPWANAIGALVGLLAGLCLTFWIVIGAFLYTRAIPSAPLSVDGCIDLYMNATNAVRFIPPVFENPEELNKDVFILYRISYLWYSLIGFVPVVVLGLIVSFLTGYNRPETTDPRLIVPVFDILMPWLPSQWREKLRFGVGKKYFSDQKCNQTVLPVLSFTHKSSLAIMEESKAKDEKEKNSYVNHNADITKF